VEKSSSCSRSFDRSGTEERLAASVDRYKRGAFSRRAAPPNKKEVAITHGALRISAIAVVAAAFVSLLPLSAASAATVVHHPAHGVHHAAGGVHRHVAHVHGRVYAHHYGHVYAHHYAHAHRYAYGHAHRYAYGYGYDPSVIGGVAAASYPYCDDDYYYGSYYGSCDYYSGGYPYWWGPGFIGGGHFHRGFHHVFAFHGGGARFASGNFGHTGFGGVGGGQMGGFRGGHIGGFGGGGFGGGHMGGFGGGHFHR
jgi:hypothetical protein